MLLAWIHAVHHRGHNRLRGLTLLSIIFPLLCILVYALDRWLAAALLDGAVDGAARDWSVIIADGRLYSDALFDVWQLWTYVFYHADMLHIFINILFFMPVAMYWERYFGTLYIGSMLLVLPIAVFVLVMSNMLPGGADVGSSPLIVAMYAGVILHARDMTATLMLASWWGTALRLRRQFCQLYWVLAVFVVLDLAQMVWRSESLSFTALYALNLLVAAGGGASVFSVLDHLRERLGLTPSPDSGT